MPSANILALRGKPLRLLGEGQPHRFRGNNPAVSGLMEMQFDRYREVASLNRHSETAEPLATSAREVELLAGQLKSADEGMRTSSAQRLSIFRDPAAAPALCEALKDKVREVRVAAAMALAACGNRESVAPLLDALTDREPLVAQAAAVALENLTGHGEDFNPFVSIEDRDKQAQGWRSWFAATDWGKIEQDLVRRLDDPNRDNRSAGGRGTGACRIGAGTCGVAGVCVARAGDEPSA